MPIRQGIGTWIPRLGSERTGPPPVCSSVPRVPPTRTQFGRGPAVFFSSFVWSEPGCLVELAGLVPGHKDQVWAPCPPVCVNWEHDGTHNVALSRSGPAFDHSPQLGKTRTGRGRGKGGFRSWVGRAQPCGGCGWHLRPFALRRWRKCSYPRRLGPKWASNTRAEPYREVERPGSAFTHAFARGTCLGPLAAFLSLGPSHLARALWCGAAGGLRFSFRWPGVYSQECRHGRSLGKHNCRPLSHLREAVRPQDPRGARWVLVRASLRASHLVLAPWLRTSRLLHKVPAGVETGTDVPAQGNGLISCRPSHPVHPLSRVGLFFHVT